MVLNKNTEALDNKVTLTMRNSVCDPSPIILMKIPLSTDDRRPGYNSVVAEREKREYIDNGSHTIIVEKNRDTALYDDEELSITENFDAVLNDDEDGEYGMNASYLGESFSSLHFADLRFGDATEFDSDDEHEGVKKKQDFQRNITCANSSQNFFRLSCSLGATDHEDVGSTGRCKSRSNTNYGEKQNTTEVLNETKNITHFEESIVSSDPSKCMDDEEMESYSSIFGSLNGSKLRVNNCVAIVQDTPDDLSLKSTSTRSSLKRVKFGHITVQPFSAHESTVRQRIGDDER